MLKDEDLDDIVFKNVGEPHDDYLARRARILRELNHLKRVGRACIAVCLLGGLGVCFLLFWPDYGSPTFKAACIVVSSLLAVLGLYAQIMIVIRMRRDVDDEEEQ